MRAVDGSPKQTTATLILTAFFIASISCPSRLFATFAQTQDANLKAVSSVTPRQLHGHLTCDDSISFENVILKVEYAHLESIYPSTSKLLGSPADEALPATISVNENGEFQLACAKQPMIFHCETQNGEQAGTLQIDELATEVQIQLRPVVCVHGKLIDSESGKPIPDQRIIAGIHFKGILEVASFGKGVTADANGRFEIPGMIAGQTYELCYVQVSEKNTISIRSLGLFCTDFHDMELGDVDDWRSWFRSDSSPLDQLTEARKQANTDQEHVLLVFGFPGNRNFREFCNLKSNSQELKHAIESFRMVAIDRSQREFESADVLAKQLGVSLLPNELSTHFCIVEAQGNLLYEIKVRFDESPFPHEKLVKAMKDHSPSLPNAQELLDAALRDAKAGNKRVFVQETGPNCGPCENMSRFLESTRQRWGVDFVWVKLDRRFPGAEEITDRLRQNKSTSIPWYAVLNSDGMVEATSFSEDGKNMGFPGNDGSRKHLFKVLKQSATRMTKADIDEMLSELDK